MNKINHLDFNRATTPLTSEGVVANCVAQTYCFYTYSFCTSSFFTSGASSTNSFFTKK
jgi:hypothetical protein